MQHKSDCYVFLSNIYFSVPVDFVVFKIKIFFWVFSHIFDNVFFKTALQVFACFFFFTGIPDTIIQFRRKYWCNRSSSADCLSSSSDILSLVFWLTTSVDSRASTLFSKVPTFFSNVVTFDCNNSTIAFNLVTSLVVLLSFLGISGLLLVLLPLVILLIFWYFSLLLFWFVRCFSSSYIFISDFE